MSNFVNEYYDAWDKAREQNADNQVHQNKIDKELENRPDNPRCTVCGEPVLYYIDNAICGECAGEVKEYNDED